MVETVQVLEDLRIRRTRHALQKALWELSSRKPFQSITIQEICTLAEVNRTTFYYHFADKYALLQYSIREQFRDIVQDQMPMGLEWSPDSLRQLMLITWGAIEAFRIHCLTDQQQEFAFVQATVTDVLSEMLTQVFSKDNAIEVLKQTPVELAAIVASWAIYGVGIYWSQQKPAVSPAALIDLVLPILVEGLH